MAYIVDGNNVMGQTPSWRHDKSAARRDLVAKLALFSRRKNVRITVVFDGAPDQMLPEASAYHGVKVLYAKPGSDADSRICRLVEESKDPRGLTVVTSDRQLAFLVKSGGAGVVSSGEFRKQMEDAEAQAATAQDGEHFEIEDMDEWFRYFGALPDED